MLSAERVAVANQAIERVFGRASVAWQAVPHWDVGDPGRLSVRGDLTCAIAATAATTTVAATPLAAPSIPLVPDRVGFFITVAQATSATPDALLTAVMARALELARLVDKRVFTALALAAIAPAIAGTPWHVTTQSSTITSDLQVQAFLGGLLPGRALLEDSGFRGGSCLIASDPYFGAINAWVNGIVVAAGGLLDAASIDSLHRTSLINQSGTGKNRMLLLGRTRDIPHGCAAGASAGEEPVDIAVSVPPSLEVVGEDGAGNIELALRIRYVTRVKDQRGIVVFEEP